MAADSNPLGRTPAATSPQATMGLLDYITAHSLDEDYAHVHEKGRSQPKDARGRPGRGALLALVIFGLLVATAAVQTARTAGATQTSHEELVADVNEGADKLDDARTALAKARSDLFVAQQRNRRAKEAEASVTRLTTRLGANAGAIPVSGPGVRLVVDDAEGATDEAHLVFDTDLRDIVNGLWEAGAEAVSINGQRLTTTSAIRFASEAITVNYQDVAAPYTVEAIGDPDQLAAKFVESTTGGRFLDTREALDLRFDMTTEESLKLPAAPAARLVLRQATTKADKVEGDS